MKAIVTGGSSGIGAACVGALLEKGADVTVIDLAQPISTEVNWIRQDLTEDNAASLVSCQLSGNYDVLINSAGLPPRPGDEARILQLNVFGLIALTERLIPRINSGGTIVNMASRAGFQWKEHSSQVLELLNLAGPEQLVSFLERNRIGHVRAYDLSKEAVIIWTMMKVEELLQVGIRINTVSPAAVATPILDDFRSAFGERADKMIKRIGRPGSPTEIANVVLFLASDASRWINGADISIDGGTTALHMSDKLKLN